MRSPHLDSRLMAFLYASALFLFSPSQSAGSQISAVSLGAASSKPLVAGTSGWVDVTTGPLGDANLARGVAFADVDNDGDLDLFLLNNGPAHQSSKLLRNEGAGVFVDVTSGPLAEDYFGKGIAFGDLDNDGDLDLYIQASDHDRVLRNEGDGTFSKASFSPLGGVGIGPALGDVNGDGLLDVYVPSDDRDYDTSELYLNQGDLAFASTYDGDHTHAYGEGGAAFADIDNDGDVDLAGSTMLRNDGGVLVRHNSGGGGGAAAAFADVDNDGDLDLLSVRVHYFRFWRNEGGGIFVDLSDRFPDVAGALGIAFGDVDNDGDLDLFADQLYLNEGGGTFVEMPGSPPGGESAVFGDVDNDGDLDIYVARADSRSPNNLYRNDGLAIGNHWLHINLVGTVSNRSAIGARVRLVADGVSQIREVSTGTGHHSQNSLTVEFGLGKATTVDSIIVRWPSGFVQVLTSEPGAASRSSIAVDRLMVIVEDSVTPALLSLASATASAEGNRIRWYAPFGTRRDWSVQRASEGEEWHLVGTRSPDGDGYIEFTDSNIRPGRRYGYRLMSPDGHDGSLGEVWLTVPALTLALQGAAPNPSIGGQVMIRFTLPSAEPANIKVLDVAGRLVTSRNVGTMGPGHHVLDLSDETRMPPGLYFVRLSQGHRSLVSRAVIVR